MGQGEGEGEGGSEDTAADWRYSAGSPTSSNTSTRGVGPSTRGVGLVVLDCDGVLIDSERLNVAIDAAWISALGWPITVAEVIDRHMGRSSADQIADVEAQLGRAITDDEAADWQRRYAAAYRDELAPIPGVTGALEDLVRQGFSMCVASSASHAALRRNLGHCDLLRFFGEGTIFSSEDVERGKPAPDLFLHAAATMGVAPDRCVVVEDSQHGVAAARAAGMPVIGYAGGITPAAMLAGADRIITDLAQLPELVATGWR